MSPVPIGFPDKSHGIDAVNHVLCAGLLVDKDTLEFLSEITLVDAPESGATLKSWASDAREFLLSIAATLNTPTGIERALKLYLEQRLAACGYTRSVVVVSVLVPKPVNAT